MAAFRLSLLALLLAAAASPVSCSPIVDDLPDNDAQAGSPFEPALHQQVPAAAEALGAAAAAAFVAAAPPGPPPRRRAAPVLAYVTPWNGAGYDLARRHRCRLDYVAPVWFQLRWERGAVALTGGHDVDASWVADLQAPCSSSGAAAAGAAAAAAGEARRGARVTPRVIWEVGGQEALVALGSPEAVASLLAEEAGRRGFDGWVFEGWSLWAAMGVTRHPEARAAALRLLRALAAALARDGRRLLLAVSPLRPAPGRPQQLTEEDAGELLGLADGLTVMTYDHASGNKPGPGAPLSWVEDNADVFAAVADRLPGAPRHKVLLGIPFYGNEWRYQGKKLVGVDAVLSGRLLEMLRQHAAPGGGGEGGGSGGELGRLMRAAEQQQQQREQQQGGCSAEEAARDAGAGGGSCAAPSSGSDGGLRVTWLDESREHLFRWKAPPDGSGGGSGKKKQKRLQHLLYYPTPEAVAERVAAAARRGMGAAVWELGQGVEEMAALL